MKERDLKIRKHIEDFGFITIKQASKIFFQNRRCSYDLARRRLKKLVEQGFFKSYMDYLNSNPEKIFYINDKYKSPSRHTILIMDTYAEIINMGITPLYFKREQYWLESNRRSDGYMIFLKEGYMYEIFIEVIYHLGTDKKSRNEDMNKKYQDIIESKESLEIVGDIVKKTFKKTIEEDITNKVILILSPVEEDIAIDNQKVVVANYQMNNIVNILI